MSKVLLLGKGKDCPKCFNAMERRSHKNINKKQAYYFTKWDFCKKCKHLQHYEEFKRYNNSFKGIYAQSKELENEQMSFLDSIE